jgi:hypothetical protein
MPQEQAKPNGRLRRWLDGRQESREIIERLTSERRARAERGSEVPRQNVTPPGPPNGVGGF